MSETLATVLKIAVAAVLIVALIAIGKWALSSSEAEIKKISPSDIGEFQPPE